LRENNGLKGSIAQGKGHGPSGKALDIRNKVFILKLIQKILVPSTHFDLAALLVHNSNQNSKSCNLNVAKISVPHCY